MRNYSIFFTCFVACFVFVLLSCQNTAERTASKSDEQKRWESRAQRVSIIRDEFGVPHIYGKTDADAVFGLMYAQCEDDFNRVEMNYINAMGRLSEIAGEQEIYRDLRMKLFVSPLEAEQKFKQSPAWLQELMVAFADGINYYLSKNPKVRPKVIQHFLPWMALTFTEGSIGTDIEHLPLKPLRNFYAEAQDGQNIPEPAKAPDPMPSGSNGFAIAPAKSYSGNTLFAINPHTSFFFRTEAHLVSEEGLNAYGAITWGQFFIYQGFNEKLGWMHTSSYADATDEYLEEIIVREGKYFYRYGHKEREMRLKFIGVPYKENGKIAEKMFTAYYTHRGPVIAKKGERWVSVQLMNRPVDALRQSYLRMKCNTFEEFKENMRIRTNSSNNTVYADAEGNIAYYHGNFVPKRNPSFDFSKPVDGSNPETDWQGLHTLSEIIHLVNPPNGWIQNCNSTPFNAAGEHSPKPENYPAYMSAEPENYRGIQAVRLLKARQKFTLESLIELAYSPYLVGFEYLFPPLFAAYAQASLEEKEALKEAITLLQKWDKKSGLNSVETTLAIFWAQNLRKSALDAPDRNGMNIYEYMAKKAPPQMHLSALKKAVETLHTDFGSLKVPFGKVNRFQRINGDITQTFDDHKPSTGVGFASSRWGSLPSFAAQKYPHTKAMYGKGGNSFVAFVEFGEKIRAKSITAGGLNSNPNSPHFNDQAEMYANGEFKDVHFYREDVENNAKSVYRPGFENSK